MSLFLAAPLSAQHRSQGKTESCTAAVLEGEVRAGQSFRKEFAPGRELFLEALPSGWIIRVLELRNGHELRGAHDWAEVATPPFQSVSPLLISTDWAFRAQDAGAWNPRSFRYARDESAFTALAALEARVLANDGAAAVQLGSLVPEQLAGSLRILDVELVPGLRDQAAMATSVASHWEETPHEVVQGATPSALGRLTRLRFRATLDLASGTSAVPGVKVQRFSCTLRPTE
ncbi:MAG: hypothetical protein PW735_11080 [Acidobacteriaceae bacterium]|nr:hypothetical protein [Acidobacteriaceae bacterium]